MIIMPSLAECKDSNSSVFNGTDVPKIMSIFSQQSLNKKF